MLLKHQYLYILKNNSEEGKNPYNAPGQPGEDILQQWRLRRKMEIARERVATGTQGEGVKHTPEQQASKQANVLIITKLYLNIISFN